MTATTQHVLVEGLVQGVFYRISLQRVARQYNVSGWCRNLPDGRVEALLQGSADAVEAVIQWCHQGPPKSTVDQVILEQVESETELFSEFEIRH